MNKKSRFLSFALIAISALACPAAASAQYAQVFNQMRDVLSPALSGSFNYKGYVEATATMGLGNDRANFVGVSTSQGFRYSSWFFMGAGLGVDVAMSSGLGSKNPNLRPDPGYAPNYSRTKCMIPLFSDFRFTVGNVDRPCFFLDIKAGATWLIGNSYLELNNGSLSTRAQFLLRPSIGLRIPTGSDSSRQAINIGVTYQLITANNSWGYWDSNYYNTTLNSLGVTVGYEW